MTSENHLPTQISSAYFHRFDDQFDLLPKAPTVKQTDGGEAAGGLLLSKAVTRVLSVFDDLFLFHPLSPSLSLRVPYIATFALHDNNCASAIADINSFTLRTLCV